ncbi:hypothetical protein WN944_027044 [Citrus x changshan-huyou]|uniref:Uncharacterized protein n=1 Tax=Citrus x changshan-huyou TaxID=2935761 RepID=A0AAP0Q9H7_9ROSI
MLIDILSLYSCTDLLVMPRFSFIVSQLDLHQVWSWSLSAYQTLSSALWSKIVILEI